MIKIGSQLLNRHFFNDEDMSECSYNIFSVLRVTENTRLRQPGPRKVTQ